MAGKIKINTERCKGCGLCAEACPGDCITISTVSNKNGYFPAQANNQNCTGCTKCAVVCPEAVIEVYRQTNIKAIETDSKNKSKLAREKV